MDLPEARPGNLFLTYSNKPNIAPFGANLQRATRLQMFFGSLEYFQKYLNLSRRKYSEVV